MAAEYIITTWNDRVMLAAESVSTSEDAARKMRQIFGRDPSATSVSIHRKAGACLQPSGQWVIHAFYTEPHKPPYRTIGPFPSYREAYNWRYDPCNAETLGDVTDVKFAEIDSPTDE